MQGHRAVKCCWRDRNTEAFFVRRESGYSDRRGDLGSKQPGIYIISLYIPVVPKVWERGELAGYVSRLSLDGMGLYHLCC